MKNALKKILAVLLTLCMIFTVVPAVPAAVSADANSEPLAGAGYELIDKMQDATILHCWNWSYKTIEDNLELIAQCGFSAVQTSPVSQPKDHDWQGTISQEVGWPKLFGQGNWWKVYQPVDYAVANNGHTWFGTKAEFQSMCAKAEQYGIKVIVDVVANHMGNISGWQNSLSDISPQVGQFQGQKIPDIMTNPAYWHINDLQVAMAAAISRRAPWACRT